MSRLAPLLALVLLGCSSGGGQSPPPPQKIALVVGPAAAGSAVQGARLAIADLNARPGGTQFALETASDGGDPSAAKATCAGLAREGVVAVVGVEAAAQETACVKSVNAAYVAAGDVAGDECANAVFFVGPTPAQRVRAAVGYAVDAKAARTFFLVAGPDTTSGEAAGAARAAISLTHAAVAGAVTAAAAPYQSTMAAIAAARPGFVLDLLPPADAQAFATAYAQTAAVRAIPRADVFGVTAGVSSAPDALVGATVVTDYLTSDPAAANRDWLAALVRHFGDGAAPSPLAAEVYDAVRLAGEAILAGATPRSLAARLRGATVDGPRGHVELTSGGQGYATLRMLVGEVGAGGLIREVAAQAQVDPAPSCRTPAG